MRVSCIIREGNVQQTTTPGEYIWINIYPHNGGEVSLAFSTENNEGSFNFLCSLRRVINETYDRVSEIRHRQDLEAMRREFSGTSHLSIFPCQMGTKILPHVIVFAWMRGWRPSPGPLLSVMNENGELLDYEITDEKDLELLPWLFEEAENYLNANLEQLKRQFPEEFSQSLVFSHHPDWGDWGLFSLDAEDEDD